jgi:hypothetical protein
MAVEADEFVFFDARDAALPPVDEVVYAARLVLWRLGLIASPSETTSRHSWPPRRMLSWQK